MKPTDDTIALTAFLLGHGWLYAGEIASGLVRLGFERPSSQWLSGHLAAMSKESSPRFERRKYDGWANVAQYHVTSWAATGLGNQWKGFDNWRVNRVLPTPQPEHLRSAPPSSGGK
jgi:hypothetical protein